MQHESGWVLGCLILGHLEFRIIRVRIGSGFELFDLRSSWVSGPLGSDRVVFQIVWSQIMLDFRLFEFGSGLGLTDLVSSRISGRSSSGWISLTFWKNQIRSGLNSDSDEFLSLSRILSSLLFSNIYLARQRVRCCNFLPWQQQIDALDIHSNKFVI
jgi:hypothetical protein